MRRDKQGYFHPYSGGRDSKSLQWQLFAETKSAGIFNLQVSGVVLEDNIHPEIGYQKSTKRIGELGVPQPTRCP